MTPHRVQAAVWFALAAALAGCSELKTDLPAGSPSGVHEEGWSDSSSALFHGAVLRSSGYDAGSCTRCHARSYNGGTSGVSCFSCHASYPHGAQWSDSSSAMFHGEFLGGSSWDVAPCGACHGADFAGGTSGISCLSCHSSYPHAGGWAEPDSASFHGVFIRDLSWDMRSCRGCHGATYAGGRTEVSCRTAGCHSRPAGPENCVTCHGGQNAAPPPDLAGATSSGERGVGAHQRHYTGGGRYATAVMICGHCHTVPGGVYEPGHVDSPAPAEVVIRAPLATADPTVADPVPVYESATLRCRNSFCHGNWTLPRAGSPYPFAYTADEMRGANFAPAWTGGATGAACGTCHGLPPTGHASRTLNECADCHTGIMNSSGAIIDKVRHLNGRVNVFAQERAFE